jgi:hypothetical protein
MGFNLEVHSYSFHHPDRSVDAYVVQKALSKIESVASVTVFEVRTDQYRRESDTRLSQVSPASQIEPGAAP